LLVLNCEIDVTIRNPSKSATTGPMTEERERRQQQQKKRRAKEAPQQFFETV
jgi:hypothetical protein